MSRTIIAAQEVVAPNLNLVMTLRKCKETSVAFYFLAGYLALRKKRP